MASSHLYLSIILFYHTSRPQRTLIWLKKKIEQTKVRTEMCSSLPMESLLNKLGCLLEQIKTMAFHITQAKAILVWAQL